MNPTVAGLAIAQALLVTGNILLVAVTALIGEQLAPSPALVTLPVALQFIGLICATLPSAHLMGWLGRKFGFVLANAVGVSGAVLAFTGLYTAHFPVFCLGTFLLGMAIGVGQQYRFAAAEAAPAGQQSRAIGYVMGGGVIAAILGPNLARWSQGMFEQNMFLGAFFWLLALNVVALVLIASLRLPKPGTEALTGPVRSYRELLRQPQLIAAITSGFIGYGVMVLVMTATPLSMHASGHGFGATASIIQWHVLGMFLPSFFTGRLIQRFSARTVINWGCWLLIASLLLNQLGTGYWQYWTALVALGVGWNFAFIGATALLTNTYQPAEKARVQGLNELLVFSGAALGGLMAGHWQSTLGWELLNLVLVPVVVLAMAVLWLSQRAQGRAEQLAG